MLGIAWTEDAEAQAAVLATQLRSANASPYQPTERFVVGEVLDHPKLGRGVVTELEEGRIVVRFADGERKLVHAR